MQTIINALIFGALLVRGAMPQPGDELIQAVKKGDRALVSRLLEAGADVNHVDDEGYSALMMAAVKGHVDIVTFLIESGASVNQYSLYHNGVSSAVLTPLIMATLYKKTEVVRILLRNGAAVDQAYPDRYSPLHIAAMMGDENGDSDIVSVLIENNANVNLLNSVNGQISALFQAAMCANVPIVAKLIRAGADVNLALDGNRGTALIGASGCFTDEIRLYRQFETISLLIRAGANINAVSTTGYTALLWANMCESENPVRALIAHGANVNQRTAMGTPLMKAIEKRNSNNARSLILAGAETSDTPENLIQEFLNPIISSLQEIVTHQSSLISMAFVELKQSEENLFTNAAFRELFTEWDGLRIDIVSRIISYLVTLESEDLHVTYVLAPFLVNADLERLNKFGLVLSFLTAPFATITNASHGSDQPELVRFIKATFRYAIVMGSFKESYDSFFDPMYAVYSNLNAEMGALKQAMRVIPDVHIGTVLQFNHGEFGIYSPFAENLKQMLI